MQRSHYRIDLRSLTRTGGVRSIVLPRHFADSQTILVMLLIVALVMFIVRQR
jgi:hypothetical protein